jgi:hypothetical protein
MFDLGISIALLKGNNLLPPGLMSAGQLFPWKLLHPFEFGDALATPSQHVTVHTDVIRIIALSHAPRTGQKPVEDVTPTIRACDVALKLLKLDVFRRGRFL